jgi:hypothetical protein
MKEKHYIWVKRIAYYLGWKHLAFSAKAGKTDKQVFIRHSMCFVVYF